MDLLTKEILDTIRAIIREELRTTIDEYVTVKDAAKLSSLAVPTIRLYIRQGKLKVRRAGRRVIISRRDLQEFIKNGGDHAKA
jgi:excisionase family DNA binding protein